ncbi:unnamed protein product [Closterium sp. Naga37s-1]|nr:unnamed protein product [Closterium sp. Naga37s-1]
MSEEIPLTSTPSETEGPCSPPALFKNARPAERVSTSSSTSGGWNKLDESSAIFNFHERPVRDAGWRFLLVVPLVVLVGPGFYAFTSSLSDPLSLPFYLFGILIALPLLFACSIPVRMLLVSWLKLPALAFKVLLLLAALIFAVISTIVVAVFLSLPAPLHAEERLPSYHAPFSEEPTGAYSPKYKCAFTGCSVGADVAESAEEGSEETNEGSGGIIAGELGEEEGGVDMMNEWMEGGTVGEMEGEAEGDAEGGLEGGQGCMVWRTGVDGGTEWGMADCVKGGSMEGETGAAIEGGTEGGMDGGTEEVWLLVALLLCAHIAIHFFLYCLVLPTSAMSGHGFTRSLRLSFNILWRFFAPIVMANAAGLLLNVMLIIPMYFIYAIAGLIMVFATMLTGDGLMVLAGFILISMVIAVVSPLSTIALSSVLTTGVTTTVLCFAWDKRLEPEEGSDAAGLVAGGSLSFADVKDISAV